LRRAIDLKAALKMGVRIGLDEIPADEFQAMLTVEEERERFDRERFEDRRS
jgi:hypothetical protein